MSEQHRQFIEALACAAPLPNVTNQYDHTHPANAIRRENLRLYLDAMAALKPRVLLIGEAPGYRGCRLTGVPFTSEAIILGGIAALSLFGPSLGYRTAGETARPCKEQTATIVWQTLALMYNPPLLWNAFPFHPHLPGNEHSNRPPTTTELRLGADYLAALLTLFDIHTVIASGNTAEKTLLRLNIPCRKIRHPANGGKRAFVEGVKRDA